MPDSSFEKLNETNYQTECPSQKHGMANLADAGEEDDAGFAF